MKKYVETITSSYIVKVSKKQIKDRDNFGLGPKYIYMVISLGYPTVRSYLDNESKYDLLDGTILIKKEIKNKYKERNNTRYKLIKL